MKYKKITSSAEITTLKSSAPAVVRADKSLTAIANDIKARGLEGVWKRLPHAAEFSDLVQEYGGQVDEEEKAMPLMDENISAEDFAKAFEAFQQAHEETVNRKAKKSESTGFPGDTLEVLEDFLGWAGAVRLARIMPRRDERNIGFLLGALNTGMDRLVGIAAQARSTPATAAQADELEHFAEAIYTMATSNDQFIMDSKGQLQPAPTEPIKPADAPQSKGKRKLF